MCSTNLTTSFGEQNSLNQSARFFLFKNIMPSKSFFALKAAFLAGKFRHLTLPPDSHCTVLVIVFISQ